MNSRDSYSVAFWEYANTGSDQFASFCRYFWVSFSMRQVDSTMSRTFMRALFWQESAVVTDSLHGPFWRGIFQDVGSLLERHGYTATFQLNLPQNRGLNVRHCVSDKKHKSS